MTLPKHQRSGVTPDQAVAPPGPSRKPVMTSSKINNAPAASHAARRPSRNPGAGATRFMLAATGSTITQAVRSSISGTTLYGTTSVSATAPVGDAGGPGQAEHGHAAAAAGEKPVGVPVVAAVELDHAVAARGAARQAHRAHGRLRPRRHETDLLAPGHALADRLRQKDLARRGRPEGGPPRRRGPPPPR